MLGEDFLVRWTSALLGNCRPSPFVRTRMAADEPADEGYEQLVRQQLDALGYDSAAIPDDVRAPNSPHGSSFPLTRLFC